jgi:hypothetical protein
MAVVCHSEVVKEQVTFRGQQPLFFDIKRISSFLYGVVIAG